MFIHDLIKIHYIEEGYLPDYPYHLISDEEMINAFMGYTYDSYLNQNIMSGYFADNYKAFKYTDTTDTYKNIRPAYDNLILTIYYNLQMYLLCKADNQPYTIPSWIYSYMLGQVISIHSDKRDIHDLITPLGVDNIEDEFNVECELACFKESVSWLRKANLNANITPPEKYLEQIKEKFTNYYITPRGTNLISLFENGTQPSDPPSPYDPDYYIWNRAGGEICSRPPTIFGEAHIIKSIRLR